MNFPFDHKLNISRRQFVAGSIGAAVASSWTASAHIQSPFPAPDLTIQQLIDLIVKEVPGAPFPATVDTIKSGRPDQKITGVVTTMFPTVDIIKKAIDLKANFMIVHEPSFYNHADETAWLQNDPVFEAKKTLLEKNQIAVWRFHDYIHTMRPDGVLAGVVKALNWQNFQDQNNAHLFNVPSLKLQSIIDHTKQSLGIKTLRYIGDVGQVCQRVLMLPGAPGGRVQISQLKEVQPDLLIAGELQEWETAEYIRDAQALQIKRSLIVLGHAQSEEPGMEWLVGWLRQRTSGFSITHIPSQNPFTFS